MIESVLGYVRAVAQDARFGARILQRTPGLTALVVIALALGIGANSAMFSVVDALLLHPLSYEKPEELAILWDRDAQGQLRMTSAGNFLDWRTAKSFSALAGWAPSVYVMTGTGRPAQVTGARVTANVFEVLGVKAFMGRTFLRGEDGLDGSATVGRVAVIGYSLWQDALGADPNVLGRIIRLNDTPYAVVGVMPAGFELMNRRHQVWVPAALNAANRDYRYIYVIGRLRTSLSEASSEMMSMSLRLAEAFPGNNRGWVTEVDGFADWLVDNRIRTRLLLLFGAVGLVLLLACSNVASLLLARSTSRSREIALRVSLGASRMRILAQLFTESLMLAAAGGALGLALAAGAIRIAPVVMPPSAIRTTAPLQLSPLVIGFTALISVLTGLLFGLAPALTALKARIQETLQDSTRTAAGGRMGRIFRQAMVMVQVAVALTLLSGALLMVQGIDQMGRTNLGFAAENVLAQRVLLPSQSYDTAKALQFYRQALERISTLPGVAKVAVGSNVPLSRISMEVPFDLENAPVREMADMPGVGYTTVSQDYFETLGIPVASGREFAATDTPDGPKVAILNAAMAARYFPNQNPVGRRIRMNKPVLRTNDFGETEYLEIVGVVGNVTLGEIGGPAQPILYVPMTQNVWTTAHQIVVRYSGNAAGTANAVREAVANLDPNQPVDDAAPLLSNLDTQFAESRFQSRLMGLFAVLALILAVTGIYGNNSYAVTQRRREFGVRMALGATPGDIFLDVLGRSMKVTLIGVTVGIVGAFSLATVLSSVFVDIGTLAWLPTLGAALLLLLVALAACYPPAVRATRVAPAVALRDE